MYHAKVGEDGAYRLVGLPGPGMVAVQAGSEYLLATDRDDADGSKHPFVGTSPYHLQATTYNALARLDPPKEAKMVVRDVALDPGLTFGGTVMGPDGKPLPGARTHGLDAWSGWERPPLETAEFKVTAFNPRRPRLLLFRHIEKDLVGVCEPPKDARKPVTVRLQPGATVTGRLVDADGRPRAAVEFDVDLRPRSAVQPAPDGSWVGYSLPTKIKTDGGGRFRIATLLPGYEYNIYDGCGYLHFGDGLRFGEPKDLGDVRLKSGGE
jgi:hypothetical protein